MKTFEDFAEGCPWRLLPKCPGYFLNCTATRDEEGDYGVCSKEECAPYYAYKLTVKDKKE